MSKLRENKRIFVTILALLTVLGFVMAFHYLNFNNEEVMKNFENEKIELPKPNTDGDVSVEQALENRRSIRDFKDEELSLEEISQLLWAAQGVTSPDGKRTAPSAGATYPLEAYIVVRKVDNLEPGVYRFVPDEHSLVQISEGQRNAKLSSAALGQVFIEDAPVNIVFAAEYERTTNRYGQRGEMYVHMEAGHAAQNLYLQSESLDLAMVVIGAFDDEDVKKVLHLPENEEPLYIIPVGR